MSGRPFGFAQGRLRNGRPRRGRVADPGATPESPARSPRGERASAPARRGIRGRAIGLAFALIPPMVLYMVYSSWAGSGTGALDSLLSSAVAGLSILVGLNLALRRVRPAWALSGAEVLALYVVLVITIGLSAGVWDWGGSVATVIAWPIWNASHENQWYEMMWPHLPMWLTIGDREVLRGFFLGDSSPYQRDILLAWLRPATWWTAWSVGLLWVSLCLNVIVRRRWSREEQLPFPMTILPLQMTEPRMGLFGSPLWWVGAVVSAGIAIINLLARFVPTVPSIPVGVDLTLQLANNRPWDALRTGYLGWSPWHVALCYLMPVDLAFSMIVFNLFWRAEYVVTRLLGWTTSPYGGFPYADQQTIGGYVALMLSVIWLDRHYLAQVLRKAAGLRSLADDREEAFSYRVAVLGALGGLAFLWSFLGRAGMGSGVALSFLLLYFVMALAMSRMRAHLGPPNHEMYGAMPEFALTEFPGTRALGPRALATLALMRPYMGEQRPNPAPAQLEALRMAERAAINPRALGWLMMAIVPFGMACYFWASLQVGYRVGLGTARVDQDIIVVARQASDKLDAWLRSPGGPNWGGVEAIGVGFLGTVALMAVKLQFPAWPLHPVAFPLAFSYPIDAMTPAMIASWLIKTLLLRYGGLRAHRRALPLFLGLLVGSATVGLLQSIAFHLLGVRA